ncbi:MAG: type II toxin-antitoxin system VapB family antitoxin [bacterium]|nr:type II toxin-antitoxin system VapB family antitoxin [bacterium]
MALNIKNPEVERLATEVARIANETKTEAIRRALSERKTRLDLHRGSPNKAERLDSLLKNRIWPSIPTDVLGSKISKAEEEEILGFGPEGV